jgi:glutamyl-tRNA synthetase
VGTAFIGLFNLAFARQHGGKFILRIEDTDQTRSTRESEEMIFRSLRWVGLKYDEGPDVGGPFGPYRQSERLPLYQKEVQNLLARGHAYKCTCTSERLEAVREEQKKRKENPGYDGHCRNRAAEVEKEIAGGMAHVVRLKVPDDGKTVFKDMLRAPSEFDNKGIDDQVLLKADGFPTYHLANVVDDHHMEITHVIRGEEWITSTPKHLLLYQGFGWEPPQFCHLPLLRNADQSKVSKRKNPTSLVFYERAGIIPKALLNYLGTMGWTMPDQREFFTLDEMVANFDITRVVLGGPVFDLKKLRWYNFSYLKDRISEDEYLEQLRSQILSDGYLKKVIHLCKERVEQLEDFVSYADYFFTGSVVVAPERLVPKGRTLDDVLMILNEIVERIDKQFGWSKDWLEPMLRGLGDEKGWKAKDVLAPVRVAITGKDATPPLFETMELLGKEVCRRRLREAAAALKLAAAAQPKPAVPPPSA